MNMNTDKLSLTFLVISLLFLGFLLVPIINLIVVNTPKALLHALFRRDIMRPIWLSFYTGMFTVFLSIIFGTPLAYLLATKQFKAITVVDAIIDLPILLPHVVSGIALLLVLGRQGIIGQPLLSHLGIQFTRTLLGTIAAQFFVSAPFYIRSAQEGFKSIDPELRKVARSCGAPPVRVFSDIDLPLCARSMFTGAILTWARAISEFSAVLIISYHPFVAPTLVYYKLLTRGFYAALVPAALLLIISLIIFAALKVVQTRSFWSYSTQSGQR